MGDFYLERERGGGRGMERGGKEEGGRERGGREGERRERGTQRSIHNIIYMYMYTC